VADDFGALLAQLAANLNPSAVGGAELGGLGGVVDAGGKKRRYGDRLDMLDPNRPWDPELLERLRAMPPEKFSSYVRRLLGIPSTPEAMPALNPNDPRMDPNLYSIIQLLPLLQQAPMPRPRGGFSRSVGEPA
jgi:hypothetical protein